MPSRRGCWSMARARSAPSGWPRRSTGRSRARPTRSSSSTSSNGSSARPHKPPARLPSDAVRVQRDGGSRPVAGTPPSDIVLGVALAADPQKYRAAAERLRSASAAAGREARRIGLASERSARQRKPPRPMRQARLLCTRCPDGRDKRAPRRTLSASSRPSCCRASSSRCCPRMPSTSSARASPATSGSRCWPRSSPTRSARSGQVGLAKRLQAGSAVGRLAPVAPGAATIAPPASLASVLPYLQQPALAAGPTTL